MHHFHLTQKPTHTGSPIPLVFLPGWGFTADILQLSRQYENHALPWIIPQGMIDPYTIVTELHSFLKKNSIARVDIVGWSMGAYVAQNFANQFPEETGRIILIAMRSKWQHEEIEKIQAELNENPEKCLHSFYRRCFLGNKKAQKQFSNQFEPTFLASYKEDLLSRGLDFLAESRPQYINNKETFLVQGRRDIIAPTQEMPDIANARRTMVNQACHAVFLADEFWQIVNPRHKNSVCQRFSKAAGTYEQHATIQKTAARLLQDFMGCTEKIQSILEIGCGTGTHTRFLTSQWPAADLVALDFSPGMINEARKNLSSSAKIKFLCSDGEQFLANPRTTFQLITSNACLQWFENIETAIKNMARTLTPDGVIACSMFGPRTLEELSHGLSEVLDQPVSLPAASFPDPEMIKISLGKYFSDIQFNEKILFRQYDSFRDLLMQLRKTGTAGLQTPPLFTPSRIRRLDKWFHKNFGGYRLSYQLILFTASNQV